jgi:hypothetical protein
MTHEESLFIYSADQGQSATIFVKKENHFGFSALSYSWVTKWLRALKREGKIFSNPVSTLAGFKIH